MAREGKDKGVINKDEKSIVQFSRLLTAIPGAPFTVASQPPH